MTADTAAVIETARRLLGLLDRLHGLRKKREDPDHDLRHKAQVELLLRSIGERKLPGDVLDYLLKKINEPPTGRMTTRSRNEALVCVIDGICEQYGLDPTRNRARHGQRDNLSGCGAVAIALGELRKAIDEATVEKIWEGRKPNRGYGIRELDLPPEYRARVLRRLEARVRKK